MSDTSPQPNSAPDLTPPWAGLTPAQIIVLGGMALILLGLLAATLVVILRAGQSLPVALVTATASLTVTPTLTPTPVLPIYVPDAVPSPTALYWPPDPQLLATPNAPHDLLWWDGQYLYRSPILFDPVASESPAGTWARVRLSGQEEYGLGRMRSDGFDIRIVAWDGAHWWEIPRVAEHLRASPGWEIYFSVQDQEILRSGGYYVYYGNLYAEEPLEAENAPRSTRLLLDLGPRQSVEWGPEVTWTANYTATQSIVSPDGRLIVLCPPDGPARDVRVRLRTVPLQENDRYRPLPAYELHVDRPPGPSNPQMIVIWTPPLRVITNWTGLPVDVRRFQDMLHFEYDLSTGTWYSIPIEFDARRGLTSVTTEQP